jgi:hypothetical protein
MEAGGVPRGQGAEGTQEVGDGAAAEGEDGGQGQDDKAQEGGARKGRGQGIEQLSGLRWQSVMKMAELAACLTSLACLSPLQAAALGARESLLVSGSYTGHGGLLGWERE